MKKEKTLSVVIPSYNAEKYLRTCLSSLCVPDLLEDLEVIIVNDGSTDCTGDIAEEYSSKYPGTVRVMHKANGGHGSGINSGIDIAAGKYFKVMDADDWADKNALCNLVGFLKKTDADIVWSGFLWAYEKEGICPNDFHKRAEFSVPFPEVRWEEVYGFDLVADRLYIKMHNLTIRTSILKEHGIRVDEKCYYVDTEYILYPIPYVRTIAFIPDFVYMYRIGAAGQSMSREKMQSNEKSINTVLRSLFRFYRSLGKTVPCTPEKKVYIENLIARIVAGKYRIMLCMEPSVSCRKRMKEFDDMLKNRYPDIYNANINKAVKLLRSSGFSLYLPASALGKLVYR